MDVLGNALTLYDLGIRVASFINGLRFAQDDLLGLRAEADCLRICVNSLGSESCQDALYRYISVSQRKDLEMIIENTLLNMEDLNKFLGSCKYLVEKDARRKARAAGKRQRWKDFMKKAWATYRFAMTNPQPFRDKLAIPTASINIFLTSMTHVGLANVGNLLSLSGHVPMPSSSLGSTSRIGSWEVVGQKIAFKRSNIIGGTLTSDQEEEVIRYARNLIKGSAPLHTSQQTAKLDRSITTSKFGTGDTYVLRRKTAHVPPASRRTQHAEDDQWSSLRDRQPLRLTAGGSPFSPSSPRIVNATPHFDISDDNSSEQETDHFQKQAGSSPGQHRDRVPGVHQSQDTLPSQKHSRYSAIDTGNVGSSRRSCRQEVEADIKREQDDAAAELCSKSSQLKSRRRTQNVQSRVRLNHGTGPYHTQSYAAPEAHDINPPASDEQDTSDEEDVIDLLRQDYALEIERLETTRPSLDNGTVAAAVPTTLCEATDEAEVETVPATVLPKKSKASRLKTETSFTQGPRRGNYSRRAYRYDPYDMSYRDAYMSKQSRDHRYDEAEDIYGQSPGSYKTPGKSRPPKGPDITIMHHDDDFHEGQHKTRGLSGERSTNLRRSASYGAAEHKPHHPPYIIRKRSQGAADQDIYMHGARSDGGRHESEDDGDDSQFGLMVRR